MTYDDILLFEVEGQDFALPLAAVQEIRGWAAVTRLPNASPSLLGMLNLRGHVLPVFDMRSVLHGKPTETTPSSVIVVVEIHGFRTGLLVGAVHDIVALPPGSFTAISPENEDAWASPLMCGVITLDQRVIPALDLERFRASQIGAAPAPTPALAAPAPLPALAA